LETPPPLPFNPYAPPNAEVAITMAAESNEPLASRSSRFIASLVDNFLILAAAIPGGVLIAASPRRAPGFALMAAGALVLHAVQWYLISTTGRSLGKRWCRLKIIRNDGGPVTFMSGVVLREWLPFALRMIPGMGTLFGLADPLFVFFQDRRCIHDHIAGTRVIEAR